ncbi:ribonuclease H-like domain-containing protein [Tanacetum coccineum]
MLSLFLGALYSLAKWYIDNEVWKVIQNGNSKKRVTKGKDGVYRVLPPTTQEEQFADEKERKARTLLLMAIPKDHLRRFHGMDDAKEIWAAIKTRFGGNANSKKMQKAVLKQQFRHYYLMKTSNHKFLRSFLLHGTDFRPMTMRTKNNIDTLSIDDLYNNPSVFEQTSKDIISSLSHLIMWLFYLKPKPLPASISQAKAQEVIVLMPLPLPKQQKRAYVLGLAENISMSFLATNADDVDLIHEDLDQIDDLDLEEMDINWQIAMTAIKIKKFYKKTGRRPRVDGKMHVAFDKRKVECFNCHNTGHFARECKFKGSKEGSRLEASREQTEDEELNHALMAFTVNNEVSMCSKLCLDSYNALQAKYDELQSEFGDQEAALTAHKLAEYGIQSNAEVPLGYEEEISRGIFALRETDVGYHWTNTNMVNKVNQFTPRPVQLSSIRPKTIKTGRVNVNTGHGNVSTGSVHVHSGTQIKSGSSIFNTGKQHVHSGTQLKSGSSRFNTGKQHVNSGIVHVNSGTQIKSGASRFNTGKQNVNSGSVHVNTARVNRPVSNKTSPKLSQVNLKSPKKCFSKQRSPVNRPFSRNTAHKSNKYAVKGKMGTAVKTSAGCVWRRVIPLSNPNSGPTPDSNDNVSRGPQGRPMPSQYNLGLILLSIKSASVKVKTGNHLILVVKYYLELERMLQAQLGHEKGHASCHLLIGCKLVVSNDVVVNLL